MMKMPRVLRLRGKRAWYLIFAAIATFLIFSWSRQRVTETAGIHLDTSDSVEDEFVPPVKPPVKIAEPEPAVQTTKSSSTSALATRKQDFGSTRTKEVQPPIVVIDTSTPTLARIAKQTPAIDLPEKTPLPLENDVYGTDSQEPLQQLDPPGRQEVPVVSATTTIHWIRQPEHFPVPTESIIQLPTGKSIKIPKIQHDFNDETTDAKISREKRQSMVKAEFKKAWAGYKNKAWLHDELSPVSGDNRDPFCGWAATLVDGLDTLWIMGMQEEFDEAARAVDLIDFTTTPRQEIPMFETTIRYLGGLLAAYDVSERRYKNLLDKAVELADIMMGAFDTPNRMPLLYYNWKPDFASQPHRAKSYSNTAELGSLSMEFTRLAQLTHEPRYYDAVARITNALSEWQDRGTVLDGVFPSNIDASGCNHTVVTPTLPISKADDLSAGQFDKEPVGYHPEEPEEEEDVDAPASTLSADNDDANMVETQIIPGQPSKAKIKDFKVAGDHGPIKKRDWSDAQRFQNGSAVTTRATIPETNARVGAPKLKSKSASSFDAEWDCPPQGLTSANPSGGDRFSMGGGQDSTYEYMPKQYLLLGGHEETYSKMYLKTVEAVRKHMLYRPMIEGERDVLFSGAIQVSYDGKMTLDPEVEHLTCFIGGMIGMGAKIFDIDGDLELAKKLTDGCVWAYEAFPTGIMPEGALVVPCQSTESCPWNETFWRESLDPMGSSRDDTVKEYITSKAKLEADAKETPKEIATQEPLGEESSLTSGSEDAKIKDLRLAGVNQVEKLAEAASTNNVPVDGEIPNIVIKPGIPKEYHQMTKPLDTPADTKPLDKVVPGDKAAKPGKPKEYHQPKSPKAVATTSGSDKSKKASAATLKKRELSEELTDDLSTDDVAALNDMPKKSLPRPGNTKLVEEIDEPAGASKTLAFDTRSSAAESSLENEESETPHPLHGISTGERAYDEYVTVDEIASGRRAEIPLTEEKKEDPPAEEFVDPNMPRTHKQFVDDMIAQELLPPGFTHIKSRKYILRPEAIESVWYMYRITGDTIWQEKGWKMFESIIKATSAEFGHSAISDVTVKPPNQIDEMESFWLAETLKYFYLLFSTPDIISLDEWVLNTEAHPFKRPV